MVPRSLLAALSWKFFDKPADRPEHAPCGWAITLGRNLAETKRARPSVVIYSIMEWKSKINKSADWSSTT